MARAVSDGARRPRQRERARKASVKSEHTALSLGEIQRARILSVMARLVDRDGVEQVSVTRVIKQAGVPRVAFYQHFGGRDDALRALVASALERSRETVLSSSERESSWQGRTRAGLHALLALYEAEPDLGRLCLTHSQSADAGIRALREEALEQLAAHIAAGTAPGRQSAGALTARCTVAGVLGVLQDKLAEQHRAPLCPLERELMSFIVLPYRGPGAARAERTRPAKKTPPRPAKPRDAPAAGLRITYRTMRVLATLSARPGLNNLQIAQDAGILDQGQISKLLKRLQALALIENTGSGQQHGAPNSWWLTEDGEKAERWLLNHHAPAKP